MSTYSNKYSEEIYNIILPLIGSMMSKTVIKLQCSKLGKTEETLDRASIPIIADAIQKGLNAFIGVDGAKHCSNRIKLIN